MTEVLINQLTIDDLNKFCNDSFEESLTLEFKSCSELVIGSSFYQSGIKRERQFEDVITELTKDVSSLLNSAGGRIIYGVREANSRAESLDLQHAFAQNPKTHNIFPEKVIEWVRHYIQPPPPVSIHSVRVDKDNPGSSWFIVAEVEQGTTAYMAFDKKFYKRVGNIIKTMEHYEVLDVLNRARAAIFRFRKS